jgi:hypothetical protein
MSNEKSETKIGAGHAGAMFRQGLAELRGAMYPESNVAQPAQYGLYGTLTPGEVAAAKKEHVRDGNEEPPSALGERLQSVEHAREAKEPEPPDMGRE